MGILDSIRKSVNVFLNRDPTKNYGYTGPSYGSRPDRPRFTRGNERSIITTVYNRIALDVASLTYRHCNLDDEDRFESYIDSGLNECLKTEANIDQTPRALIQDIIMKLLDNGSVAIVPIDTSADPEITSSYDIYSMRTGEILEWKPLHIKVRVYNDRSGLKEDVWVQKRNVAIIENPLYAVTNEPNSTAMRLIRKLGLLDVTDDRTASNKLDMIVQLPYAVKSDMRREQANKRMKDLEDQLSGSKYGIAYADSTEKITQLNRSLENNLLKQVEYLTTLLFSQLGMTQGILDGSADEQTMLNYYNRTIEPLASAIVDEMKRKFLTKTARTRKQTIMAFRDPFKLVPVTQMAELADKFTRNEITSSNEIRQSIGMKPSSDPKADQLVNSNISQPTDPNMMDPNMMDPNMMDPNMEGDEEFDE